MLEVFVITKENEYADKININAYLSPHPLDEDSCLEPEDLKCIPGFDDRSIDEDGIYPSFRDNNLEIYKRIETITEKMFRGAVKNMWPLLNNYVITRISIAIDYTGILLGNNSLAAYNHVDSRPECGYYHFDLTRSFLIRQLHKIDAGEDLGLKFNTTWEHELVHLLDHWESVKSSIYRNSSIPDECYKYFLLKFRTEGIAELYYLLKGGREDVKNMNEALLRFKDKVEKRKAGIFSESKVAKEVKETISNDYDFYEIGPWVILNYLKSHEGGFHADFIDPIINRIENSEIIEQNEILETIKIALRIKSEDFILSYFREIKSVKN